MDSVPPEPVFSDKPESLTHHLTRTFEQHLKPHIENPAGSLRVLSVGCGIAEEVPAVFQAFPNASYRGIDVQDYYLDHARGEYKSFPNATFEYADARKKEAFGIDRWDIVLLRNPQTVGFPSSRLPGDQGDQAYKEQWRDIVNNAIDAVTENGALYVETFAPEDKRIMERYLQERKQDISVVFDHQVVREMGFGRTPAISDILVARKV